MFYIIPLNSAIDTCTSAYEVSLHSLLGPSIFLLCLCQSFQKFLYMQVGRRVHKVWFALCTDSSSPHTHGPQQLWQDSASHSSCVPVIICGSLPVNTRLLLTCAIHCHNEKPSKWLCLRFLTSLELLGQRKCGFF